MFFLAFKICVLVISIILIAAYLTYIERKIVAWIQLRSGPNVTGPLGLLQPVADAIKLFSKESLTPDLADKKIFLIAPAITFTMSLSAWAVIPFNKTLVLANINLGILHLIASSTLGIYGIILGGWSSNSKYSYLGAIRSAAQMISYEVIISLILTIIIMVHGSLNLIEIIESQSKQPFWLQLLLFPMMIIFFIATLAETNRHPFDLPEAEAELAGGYNVEYSSTGFALFFLGEYANMILASVMTTIFFLKGYLPPFNLQALNYVPGIIWLGLKTSFVLFCFIWIKATTPRYRYDQLMRICWQFFLPIVLIWFILIANLIYFLC